MLPINDLLAKVADLMIHVRITVRNDIPKTLLSCMVSFNILLDCCFLFLGVFSISLTLLSTTLKTGLGAVLLFMRWKVQARDFTVKFEKNARNAGILALLRASKIKLAKLSISVNKSRARNIPVLVHPQALPAIAKIPMIISPQNVQFTPFEM